MPSEIGRWILAKRLKNARHTYCRAFYQVIETFSRPYGGGTALSVAAETIVSGSDAKKEKLARLRKQEEEQAQEQGGYEENGDF